MRPPLFILSLLGAIAALTLNAFSLASQNPNASITLVSFTAEWCPNCKILDPKMDKAMEAFADGSVTRIILDMTDAERRAQSFEKINGTLFANVYGDHLGVTGIGIITATDSGEKIGCVTREHSVQEIITALEDAKIAVANKPPYERRIKGAPCPKANSKISL